MSFVDDFTSIYGRDIWDQVCTGAIHAPGIPIGCFSKEKYEIILTQCDTFDMINEAGGNGYGEHFDAVFPRFTNEENRISI